MIYFILFTILILYYLFIVLKRAKKYRYDTSKDYVYDLEKNYINSFNLKKNNFFIKNEFKDYDTVFLKINLSRRFLSYFFKPYLEFSGVKHFLEYGASGVRYINISNMKDEKVEIILHNMSLKNYDVDIFAYKNNINTKRKILIFAPHADDAELAAFGLYKDAHNVTIVTTTAGEHGMCKYCNIYNNDRGKQSLKKGKLRAYDAVTVPLLGGVDMKNSIALGYFGGSLEWMYNNRNQEASSVVKEVKDMNIFRKVSHSNIKLPEKTKPTYESFLEDIKLVLESVQADIIITPHIDIDSHADHKYTSIAILEVMKNIAYEAKLLLYTNHLSLSETYPIGEIHSSISLPPNRKDFYFDSLYSFHLDKDTQIDKFFALEAIHDLRDSEVFLYINNAYKYLMKMLKRKIIGKDKSYYKRAIRDNELFFVVEKDNIDKLKYTYDK